MDGKLKVVDKKAMNDGRASQLDYYQALINDALRTHIQAQPKSFEDTLRKVIREELRHVC